MIELGVKGREFLEKWWAACGVEDFPTPESEPPEPDADLSAIPSYDNV